MSISGLCAVCLAFFLALFLLNADNITCAHKQTNWRRIIAELSLQVIINMGGFVRATSSASEAIQNGACRRLLVNSGYIFCRQFFALFSRLNGKQPTKLYPAEGLVITAQMF